MVQIGSGRINVWHKSEYLLAKARQEAHFSNVAKNGATDRKRVIGIGILTRTLMPSDRFRCEECNAISNLRIWRLRRSRRELARQE